MSSTQSESRGSSSPPRALARGQACMPCRWRKIRCDGVRPSCGQCASAQTSRECQYGDANISHASNLQKTITQLEARLRQLEQGEAVIGSSEVLLHDPYSESFPAHSPSPSRSGSASAEAISSWPSAHTREILVNTFFQHTQSLPWFLHEGRYRQALALPDADLGHPIAAVNTAVLLWGGLLHSRSSRESSNADTTALLDHASSQIEIQNVTGQHAIQIIQARLLLALYFFDAYRVLEGRAHLAAAISCTIRLRLHKIRSADSPPQQLRFLDPITVSLPEPRDALEEGERIRAFWTVFCLSRMHSVMFGHYSLVLDSDDEERRIDTPWPLDINMYELNQMPRDLRTIGTSQGFFEGVRSGWPWENDMLSFLAKASALFERTAHLAEICRREDTDPVTSYSEFANLDRITDELEAQLAPLTAGPTQKLHLAQSLILASRIQLHSAFAQQSPISRMKCLSAAQAVWNISITAHVDTSVYLDSVIGWIWAAACRVIMEEIVLLRAQHAVPMETDMTSEAQLMQALNGLLALMTVFAATSSVMNYHLSRVEQERLALC